MPDPVTVPIPRVTPVLMVLAGPSGTGKSTLLKRFLDRADRVVASVSATTREPRPGEVDGRDYHFLSRDDFQKRIDDGGFLEYAQVFGQNWYGTPRSFIDECFAESLSVITDIDVQGAEQIRRNMPASIHVFVTPPDWAELERRLRGRGTESDEVVQRRLDEARVELERVDEFDYFVVNADLDEAVADLLAIYRTARLRRIPPSRTPAG